jgi:hypothetical protein
MLSSGYAFLYQKGKQHRAIFYLNKHKENNMKLYQKKVQPAYFSCQEMDDIPGAEGRVGGGQEIANGYIARLTQYNNIHLSRAHIFKCLWSPGINSKELILSGYVA